MSSYRHPLRQTQLADDRTAPHPHRMPSTASTNSSAYSGLSDPFAPSRTSTVSSLASSGYSYPSAGHKRGISDAAIDHAPHGTEGSPANAYKSVRSSLRPLPQAPAGSTSGPTPPLYRPTPSPGSRAHYHDASRPPGVDGGGLGATQTRSQPTTPTKPRTNALALGRSGSIRPSSLRASPAAQFTAPDVATLGKSSTSHLRTLSKLTRDDPTEDFAIHSPAQEVVGMHGRRKLQRSDTAHAGQGKSGASRSAFGFDWMDKQRQFLQAYEYLCHIGEAKEWIEKLICKPIPPIVQLEEALRDGVTLAEVVQAVFPRQPVRIFRHERLQFRHSDNIALFFRFLADVELPELFRFELIDLYEKKNIPKVIYCIHALSWLLYRKELVDFRIGNLVGQLEFEHHELEEMQKGLDRAGVSMPSFSGMGASFGAEPEPEPVETEQERVDRELSEHEAMVVDLQAQVRGALARIKLGNDMQLLWDAEVMLVDLQARLRGDWARQIAEYRLGMRRFAVNLQGSARGFLVRARQHDNNRYWIEQAQRVVVVQSVVRAHKARAAVQHLKVKMRREESGIRNFPGRNQGRPAAEEGQ